MGLICVRMASLHLYLFIGLLSNAAAVTFQLARRAEPNGRALTSGIVPLDFDRTKPTYVLLHGMGGSPNDSCMRGIQAALLQRADVNVISADYSATAFGYVAVYRTIAWQVSSFLLKNAINPWSTTVLGQSMGAQIAGVLYQYKFKPSSIIGMDPAGPQFNSMSSLSKLSPSSALSVQAIHTNVGGLGSTTLDGTFDVYINQGSNFPCCSTAVCRHTGACHWLASTIRNGLTSSTASICSSQSEALRGTCQGLPIFAGFDAPPSYGRIIAHVSLNQCVPRST